MNVEGEESRSSLILEPAGRGWDSNASMPSWTTTFLSPGVGNGNGTGSPPSFFPVGMGIGGAGTNENASLADEGNYWPLRDPLSVVIPITVIYGLIFLTGLLGNVVTCVVIVRSRYLHTTTNYYLFSLAVSDLVLLLSGLPPEMISIWRRYPDPFGEAFCVLRGLASETSANATVLTITAFTVERYLAICRPFILQKWQNNLSRVIRQILLIWVLSILLAVPQVRKTDL